MDGITGIPQWEDKIYLLKKSDPVIGGEDGISNRQAKELANRTQYLKNQQGNHQDETATEEGLGHVKVDGNTITIDENGVISAGTPAMFRYGIKINKHDSNPDTRVEYLHDAVGMIPASMNFSTGEFSYGSWRGFCEWLNAPVMLNYNGTVAYRLDRNDQTKKADGTASDIGNTSFAGNAMAQFRRLWLKQYQDDSHEYVIFSNVQYDEDYHAWAFTDQHGNIRDFMYHAMYEGSYVAPRLRSLATGSIMVSETGQTEITRAEANGSGWSINYKSQQDFIMYLLWLISKSTADQGKFGNGNSGSATHVVPGTLKGKGQFQGYSTTDQAVKVFYIENFWGNCWRRLAGMLMNIEGEIYTKMTPPYPQPALPDENVMPVGYQATGVIPSGAYGAHLQGAQVQNETGFLPQSAGGSATTYYTCGLWYLPGAKIMWAIVGSSLIHTSLCGAGATALVHPLSHPGNSLGATLSYLEKSS